jgi:glycosyltransferase involved in cell wall biosynthesis
MTPDPSGPDLISVILPVYNGARFLAETIESVLAQSHSRIELIVVDDGSTDQSAEIALHFADLDQRVTLLRQRNAGVGTARNAGIAHAAGRFIALIDADDLWHPRKLEKQLAAFTDPDHSIGLVYCASIDIDEQSRPLSVCNWTSRPQGIVWLQLFVNNFTGNASTPLIRADCLKESGGFDESFFKASAYGTEDWDLALRIAGSYQLRCVPECLVGYRRLSESMSCDTNRMKRSWDMTVQKTRTRGWIIEPRFYRWSESAISRYLASQAIRAGQPADALRWIGLAVRHDPLCLVDVNMSRTLIKVLRSLLFVGWTRRAPTGQRLKLTWLEAASTPKGPDKGHIRLWKRIQARRTRKMIQIQRSTPFPIRSHDQLSVRGKTKEPILFGIQPDEGKAD